ncbi:MAG: hypothetical protein ACK5QT_05075 [Oligoflexia bacterium]|jgi:hypothetical protein
MSNSTPYLLSMTYLKLRGLRALGEFLSLNEPSYRQAQKSSGLIAGSGVIGGLLTFCTVTLWEDLPSMQNYIGKDAHLRAMPKLRSLCSEAISSHQSWSEKRLPNKAEFLSLLAVAPKFIALQSPSARHQAKQAPTRLLLWLERPIL